VRIAVAALASLGLLVSAGCAASGPRSERSGSRTPTAPPVSAGLPEWARGWSYRADPGAIDLGDVIRYRTLAREDFRSEAPPGRLSEHRDQLGATTCAYLKPVGEARVEIRGPLPGAAAQARYEVALRELRFEAVMDRRCSWWNDRSPLDEIYVLQHEQIHFALVELAARRLNDDVERLAGEPPVRDATPEGAAQKVRGQIDAHLAAAQAALLAEGTRFDEDTSRRVDREKQQQWWERVQRDLAGPSRR
jgi:hypothetical protein